MRPLPRPLQALVTWTAILPLVLSISAVVTPLTTGWPDPLRMTLVITLVVPLAVFWAVPLLARATQRLRGVPAPVIAAACPAPGLGRVPAGEGAMCAGGGATAGGGASISPAGERAVGRSDA
ncbi:MAG: hypothetical protein PGN24_04225 [Microbacterium arborescens]